MRLFVTGGSGFLGGYVLREASRRGHETVALARSPAAARTVARCGAHPITGNLDDAGHLDRVFAATHCEVLVNLASLGFGHAPAVVAAASEAGISRAVFVSSTTVTTTLPAPTKRVRLAAEQRIRASALRWTILRPTMIYGAPGDRNLSRLLELLHRTPVLPVPGGGRHLQQPVYVADAADAVLSAVERPATVGGTYDIAGPQALTFAEVLRTSAQAVASRTRFLPVPLSPLVGMVRGYERLSQHPRIRAEQLLRLAEDKVFAIDSAACDLSFSPRTFAAGIRAEAQTMGLAQWD
jgi:uncharacterized protein YbjT (DUF2867 family)